MDGGQVLGRAGRQRPVELGQRAGGGQGLGALDQVALELAPQVALEAVELVAVDRRPLLAAVLGRRLRCRRRGRACGGSAARRRRPRPSPRPGGRRRRSPAAPGRASRLVAVDDRLADLLAQLVDVEPLAALVAPRPPRSMPALDRLGLGGAEEVAVEEQLEDAAVLLGLGDRRRQRLAEVVLRGPGDLLERGEGVEDLRGADRDPLAAQLLAEAEQLRRQPRRAGVRPSGPYGGRQASPRPARRPGRCRCGA